ASTASTAVNSANRPIDNGRPKPHTSASTRNVTSGHTSFAMHDNANTHPSSGITNCAACPITPADGNESPTCGLRAAGCGLRRKDVGLGHVAPGPDEDRPDRRANAHPTG